MSRFLSALAVALLLLSAYQFVFPGSAAAHERRSVSKYQLVVGFIVEPALEGQKNGVDLRVTNNDTKKPVEGLEKTLQVEITHVPSGTSKTFSIRAIFNDTGHYTNDLILTTPGQFRFRFFGNIEGMTVNETFVSGPGTFSDAGASAELQFPQQFPQIREVAAAVQGSQNTANEARGMASSARTLAVIGLALGALGIATGAGSVVIVMRRK